jgi:hypothetical protein
MQINLFHLFHLLPFVLHNRKLLKLTISILIINFAILSQPPVFVKMKNLKAFLSIMILYCISNSEITGARHSPIHSYDEVDFDDRQLDDLENIRYIRQQVGSK